MNKLTVEDGFSSFRQVVGMEEGLKLHFQCIIPRQLVVMMSCFFISINLEVVLYDTMDEKALQKWKKKISITYRKKYQIEVPMFIFGMNQEEQLAVLIAQTSDITFDGKFLNIKNPLLAMEEFVLELSEKHRVL